ncbi:MAG: FAD-dependent oxidoreductase [Lachnospiraceae bacterium]|nr:FAD-dependent oxidoreductase [Lachnospiraceae bacterium]
MSKYRVEKTYQVVVVGGGLSGVCAAIASARNGAKTAIVQNRSMFGGNASSEIRMHVLGASAHGAKKNLSETGILLEILLENKRRNPYASFPVFDSVIWEKVRFQENLDSYLNTNMDDVVMDGRRVKSIICHQNTTETEYVFSADVFVDATGHGTLSMLAGATGRMGSESRDEFHEPNAPELPNEYTMGNTVLFSAIDRGEPVKFIKPYWAYTFSEEDLRYRDHGNSIGSHADGGALVEFEEGSGRLPHFSNVDSGYWWVELGGQYDDIIRDGEVIRDELLKCVYGVWDHLKNVGDHGVENLDLNWVGIVPGYRESRRIEGDYLLNENDVRSNRIFPDAVAYGGWQMDEHVPGGIMDFDKLPSRILNFDGCYTIPYRCFYAKDVENVMLAGRDISTTKMAFGSTRVMGTCAVGGQAAGTAAALAVKYGCSPRMVGEYIDELQQILLRDDCYIPGFRNHDEKDMARNAVIEASGYTKGNEPEKVINGVARPEGDESNCWEAKIGEEGAWISLSFDTPIKISEVQLAFDPNLTKEIMPSLTRNVRARQVKGMPHELVKDYSVRLFREGQEIACIEMADNYQRLNRIYFKEKTECDRLIVTVKKAHGIDRARIYEIRTY